MTELIPAPAMLRKLLRYEPDTGLLFWRERPVEMFANGKRSAIDNCNAWNGRFANKEAFTADNGDGYRLGRIFYRMHKAHRVIWALETGAWPEAEIDHTNGITDDNRMSNLRDVSSVENGRNQKFRSTNTSGTMGVSWYKSAEKWRAQIRGDGIQIHLGYFTSKSDAIAARAVAETKYGFHANHGRPALGNDVKGSAK